MASIPHRENVVETLYPRIIIRILGSVMTLSAKQSETLRKIRDLEMSGQMRFIYAAEAQVLCDLALVKKQPGIAPSYRLTAKGWKALDLAAERLSLLVTL